MTRSPISWNGDLRDHPRWCPSCLPVFWLLVPGALGLIGVAEYLGQDPLAGVQDFLGAVGSMVAIGLGVLCGYPLYRSLARTLGWLQELGSG